MQLGLTQTLDIGSFTTKFTTIPDPYLLMRGKPREIEKENYSPAATQWLRRVIILSAGL